VTLRPASRIRATQPASSARTISAISTRCCRPTTASTSFYGNLYHLNAEEEPEQEDYPNEKDFRTSRRRSARAESCTVRDDRTMRPSSRGGAEWASRRSRIPVAHRSAWKPATTISSRAPRNSCRKATTPASPSIVWPLHHMRLHAYKPESKGQAGRLVRPILTTRCSQTDAARSRRRSESLGRQLVMRRCVADNGPLLCSRAWYA